MANGREQLRVAALLVLCACSSSKYDEDAHAIAAADPAAASQRVRAIAKDCAGLARALDALAASRIETRLLGGLVDDAIDSAHCVTITGTTAAHQLARARLADARPAEALAALTANVPAAHYRRAELLDRAGQPDKALAELAKAALDEPASAQKRLLEVSVAARRADLAATEPGTSSVGAVVALIERAPLDERPRLAFRAAADAPPSALAAFAMSPMQELAFAATNRLEESEVAPEHTAGPERPPVTALAGREHIAAVWPDVAEHWDALARARLAANDLDGAVAAWDRAIAIAPAQPMYRLAPIGALPPARARARAAALAASARAHGDVESIVTASDGAAVAHDTALALALAREAQAKRSGDGRLAFLVARRLDEAGDSAAAASAYVQLLACGAHGKPWHRHEVAGKLLALPARHVRAALDTKSPCETVDAQDLATYVAGLRSSIK